jgi:regulator of ribonuclease activity A
MGGVIPRLRFRNARVRQSLHLPFAVRAYESVAGSLIDRFSKSTSTKTGAEHTTKEVAKLECEKLLASSCGLHTQPPLFLRDFTAPAVASDLITQYRPIGRIQTSRPAQGSILLATTDLCDAHTDLVQIAAPSFRNYGAKKAFFGAIATVKVFEDTVLVRAALEESGSGRVLVVDGAGSLRCALIGELVATLAMKHGWAGIVLNAAVRDVEALAKLELGICALAAHPKKSGKMGRGNRDITVTFAGVSFRPGEWLVSDADGIVTAPSSLPREVFWGVEA